MDLSIIIPVYNVEEYIYDCLYSVLNIDNLNYEIILINDGSTDRSGDIIKEFAKKYHNIKIIEQENKGLSAARNKGIQNAIGEYILFVDSDDYLLNRLC